jgi:hypothetical protein
VAATVNEDRPATPQRRPWAWLLAHGVAALRAYWDFALLGATFVGMIAWLLVYRQVNLDEGWYLWASKLVYEGKLLYRDFAYTQTPLLPYVYGLNQRLFGEGLIQGRLLTALCVLAAVGLSVGAAARIAGRTAALVCLALCVVSTFALAQFTYTATYALTALLMGAALYVAVGPWPENRRIVVAASLFCLAIAVRLSVAAAAPPFLLYLILTSDQRRRALLLVGLAALGTLGVTLGIYWLLSGEMMLYDILGFHTDRLLKAEWHRLRMWHSGERAISDFFVLVGVTLTAAATGIVQMWASWQRSSRRENRRSSAILLTVAAMSLALFVVHLIPRTTDSYYNSLQAPLICVVGGVLVAHWLRTEEPTRRRFGWLLIALLVFTHGARQWRAFAREKYIAQPARSQVAVVREAANLLRRLVTPGGELLSFSPHLALESGLRLKPGYEMAIFAYQPTWSNEQVTRYHVVNNEQLLRDLRSGADAVALTGFDLEQIYGEREAVQAILGAQYRWVAVIPDFGPYNDELNLYLAPQFGESQPQVRQPTSFADEIDLLGYDLQQTVSAAKSTITLALYWRANTTLQRSYTVFVQLLDGNGVRVAGWDNPPCRTTCPTTTWQPGEILRDEYTVDLHGLLPGSYTLHIGMYDAESGVRLSRLDEQGRAIDDNLSLTAVSVE